MQNSRKLLEGLNPFWKENNIERLKILFTWILLCFAYNIKQLWDNIFKVFLAFDHRSLCGNKITFNRTLSYNSFKLHFQRKLRQLKPINYFYLISNKFDHHSKIHFLSLQLLTQVPRTFPSFSYLANQSLCFAFFPMVKPRLLLALFECNLH
jgi:hypothetical protein